MRVVFVGASTLAQISARIMLEEGHEVVIIEKDEAVIEALADEIDCGFLHGDGSRPRVLKEVDPDSTDCVICVSDDDTANILAALVARELAFNKVIVRIEDTDLEQVCEQLGLENVMIPDRQVAQQLLSSLTSDDDTKPEV